ncbi:MAG: ParB family protein [Microbacterium sp.]|uniref:ParB family protein n=1 Tax=Microbacterium sp. TaxID=51671 RepID=UPI003F98E5EE
MTRPAPRKSSLAGFSPVAPQPERQASPAPAAQEAEPTTPTPAGRVKRKKVSFEQHPEDTARMRGAVVATMLQEPHRSLTDFINRAVMAEVERLERKYNGGKPFDPVQTGVLAPGRRMGE